MAETTETPIATSSTEDQQVWQRWKSLVRCDFETGEMWWLPRPNTSAFRHAGQRLNTVKAKNGYRMVFIEGKRLLAHRVIWVLAHGELPQQIDHIDGNRANNALSNLRNVDARENHRNMAIGSHNTSGFMGVCWDKSRSQWMVTIKDRSGKGRTVGRFKHKPDAIEARKAAIIHYGYHENHGRGSIG